MTSTVLFVIRYNSYKQYGQVGNFQKIKPWPGVLAKRLFEQKGAQHISALRWGGYCPLLLLTFMPTKSLGEVRSIFCALDNAT